MPGMPGRADRPVSSLAKIFLMEFAPLPYSAGMCEEVQSHKLDCYGCLLLLRAV